MNKERGIICLYKGLKKDDPTSVILIEQGEEGKSIAMFEDPAVKTLIEKAGHIYDSTFITNYFNLQSIQNKFSYIFQSTIEVIIFLMSLQKLLDRSHYLKKNSG